MTLLTIARGLAKNVGLAVPDTVFTSATREMIEVVEQSNIAGDELARRVDWGKLQSAIPLAGDGTNKEFHLGDTFSRIGSGIAMTTAAGFARPLSRAEWGSLVPVVGVPRYFLLEGQCVTLWPYLADGELATVNAQSLAWCSNGTSEWAADDDTSLIDEGIFLKGLIVRWRRQKGMDYADYEAEYEAALAEVAGFDDRSRL